MNELRIETNKQFNGIEVYFNFMPYSKTRLLLKNSGFKWHFMKKCWYARDCKEKRDIIEKAGSMEKSHKPYVKVEKSDKPEVKEEKPEMFYRYGMRIRGFSIGCQPKEGFIQRIDDTTGKYYDIIEYDRKLSDEEVKHYSLDFLPEIKKEEAEKVEKVEKVVKKRKSTVEKAMEKLKKSAAKNPAVVNHNGYVDGFTYITDGIQLMKISGRYSENDIEKSKVYENIIKTFDEAEIIDIPYSVKEVKESVKELKNGKRVKVAYSTEKFCINTDFLINGMEATGSNKMYYIGSKSPVMFKNEDVIYIICLINSTDKITGFHTL